MPTEWNLCLLLIWNCPCHYEGNGERMEDVNENEVEELMYPEEVGGGEPYGLQPQGGRRDQAGDRHREDGPPVEQGWVLLEGEQVSAEPGTRTDGACQVHEVLNPCQKVEHLCWPQAYKISVKFMKIKRLSMDNIY